MDKQIARVRNRIDALDRALVRLLSRRARYSLEIGRRKRAAGGRLFSHARERQIAENVRRANRGPLPDRILVELYETLLRLTRRAVRDALRREERARDSRGNHKSRGAAPQH
jgi:chorismate mutase/prephenate dehydratase